ncbi:MAG: hypothetical protein R2882_06160 [Gemmatimonadales bacterium]
MPAESAGPAAETRSPWRFAEHVGTGVTVGYLVLAAIGMLHLVLRYFRFRLNILDFADPADFLIAPFRDPVVVVATVLPAAAAYYYSRVGERWGERLRIRRRAAGKPVAWWETKEENLPRMRQRAARLRILAAVVWVFPFSAYYQRWAADQIMIGRGQRVVVETTGGVTEAGTTQRPVMLIGTTSRYVFLFRTEDWRSVVIPAENVLRIVPDAIARGSVTVRPRMIQAMDSAAATAP